MSGSSGGSQASVRTTASGAAKRNKKKSPAPRKKTKRRQASADVEREPSSSDMEGETLAVRKLVKKLEQKRPAGRPPTTGKHVGLSRARQIVQDRERMRRRREQAKRRKGEGKVAPPVSTKGGEQEPGQSNANPDDCHRQHTGTLHLRIQSQVDDIFKVARSSQNLKGDYVKKLKDAAINIEAAAEEMAERTAAQENEILRKENARLKEEVTELRKDIAELRKEIKEMWRTQPALPPSSSVGGGAYGGGGCAPEDRETGGAAPKEGEGVAAAAAPRCAAYDPHPVIRRPGRPDQGRLGRRREDGGREAGPHTGAPPPGGELSPAAREGLQQWLWGTFRQGRARGPSAPGSGQAGEGDQRRAPTKQQEQ